MSFDSLIFQVGKRFRIKIYREENLWTQIDKRPCKCKTTEYVSIPKKGSGTDDRETCGSGSVSLQSDAIIQLFHVR